MLFCSHCGARIPEDASFCYKCGTKIVIPEWDTEFRKEDEERPEEAVLKASPTPSDAEHPAETDAAVSGVEEAVTDISAAEQTAADVSDDVLPEVSPDAAEAEDETPVTETMTGEDETAGETADETTDETAAIAGPAVLEETAEAADRPEEEAETAAADEEPQTVQGQEHENAPESLTAAEEAETAGPEEDTPEDTETCVPDEGSAEEIPEAADAAELSVEPEEAPADTTAEETAEETTEQAEEPESEEEEIQYPAEAVATEETVSGSHPETKTEEANEGTADTEAEPEVPANEMHEEVAGQAEVPEDLMEENGPEAEEEKETEVVSAPENPEAAPEEASASPAEMPAEQHFNENDLLRVLEGLRPRSSTVSASGKAPGSDLTAEVESIRRLFSEIDMEEDSLSAIGTPEMQVRTEPETETEPEIRAEPETGAEPESRNETETVAEPEAEPETVTEQDNAAGSAEDKEDVSKEIPSVNYLQAAKKERFVPDYLAGSRRAQAETVKTEEPEAEPANDVRKDEEIYPSDSLEEAESLKEISERYADLLAEGTEDPAQTETLKIPQEEEAAEGPASAEEEQIPEPETELTETVAEPEGEDTVPEGIAETEPAAYGPEEAPAAEEPATEEPAEEEAVQAPSGDEAAPAKEVIPVRESEKETEDETSSEVHTAPAASNPIKVSSGTADKEAAERRIKGGLLALLAIAAAVGAFLWYYLTLPDNVYIRHLRRAERAAQQGDIAAASAEYNQALEIRPDSMIASDRLREYWNTVSTEADDLAQRSQFEQALEKAKLLKQIRPENANDAAMVEERILSAWASAAVIGGNEGDVDRVLAIAGAELSESGYERITAVIRDTRARISYFGYFTRTGDRCLELNAAEDRSYILSLMNEMAADIAQYAAQGGTFPVRTGSNPLGAEAAFYYEEGNALQIYIGEFDEYGERTKTAVSYVMSYSGNSREYWYYNCGWRWNQPYGDFSASCYGADIGDGVDYVTSGTLVDGLFEGQRTITPEGEDTFYLTYSSGYPEVLAEEESDGTRDVVGYTDDENDWIGMDDEAVRNRTGLPYVY